MGTTADKLNKLLETKQAIKQAIIDKGVDVSDDTVFADYPSKINAIESGEGGGVDPYIEYLWIRSTNNNTNYSYLFDGYVGDTLDISKLDTSNVANMRNMFNDCSSLTSLDLSNFNTSKVTNMTYMFNYCEKLTSLDLSNFNTSKITNMAYMFYHCNKLTSLDVNHFDISKVTNMGYMFRYCSSLTELNCSSWDISHITSKTYLTSAFNDCTSLVDFYPPQNINAEFDVRYDTKLSHDSLVRIINNLMTKTSTTKLSLGAENLAKLSDEEKAIATNKGWTLS